MRLHGTIALLEEQAANRLPELVPIRYGRMSASPFAFFRGAAYVMASDLAGTPRSGIRVQLCGDAHLANFGGFASPSRDLGSTATTTSRRLATAAPPAPSCPVAAASRA